MACGEDGPAAPVKIHATIVPIQGRLIEQMPDFLLRVGHQRFIAYVRDRGTQHRAPVRHEALITAVIVRQVLQ